MKFQSSKIYIVTLILLSTVNFYSCSKLKSQQSDKASLNSKPQSQILNQATSNPKDDGVMSELPESQSTNIDNQQSIIDSNGIKFANRYVSAEDITNSDSWIIATNPLPNATDVISTIDDEDMRITFKYDMYESTLNKDNILIFEGKHSRLMSDEADYKYNYDKKTRTLHIIGSKSGSLDGVQVLICGEIKNLKGESMPINVKFGYSTK